MSKIQWTERTWNPIVGCTRVAEGCKNCYAETMARRHQAMGTRGYEGVIDHNGRWSGRVNFVESALDKPLRWKRPSMIFVNSMSDLFHTSVGRVVTACIIDVMRQAHWHTFQVLTKRPERMRDYLSVMADIPPNIWWGASCSTQREYDETVAIMRGMPGAVRFLSLEPILEHISLGYCGGINWIIVGGESGPGARPVSEDWNQYSEHYPMRTIVRQCQEQDIPVFVKQLGSYWAKQTGAKDSKGGDMAEWPDWARARQWPKGWEGTA